MTLVKDTDGNIFGGFTTLPWESPEGGYAYKGGDEYAFLFSVDRQRIIPQDEDKDTKSIHCDEGWGPSFGYGDLVIEDMCTLNKESWTELKKSYGKFLDDVDPYFLTKGKNKFQVDIYEVFTLEFIP